MPFIIMINAVALERQLTDSFLDLAYLPGYSIIDHTINL